MTPAYLAGGGLHRDEQHAAHAHPRLRRLRRHRALNQLRLRSPCAPEEGTGTGTERAGKGEGQVKKVAGVSGSSRDMTVDLTVAVG